MDAMLLVKASLLLVATLLAARLLRRASAASRHRLWTVAFAAVLALPLLSSLLPAVRVPVPYCCAAAATPEPYSVLTASAPAAGETPAIRSTTIVRDADPLWSGPSREEAPRALPAMAHAAVLDVRALLLAVWGLGALAAVSMLMLSLVRVRRLVRGSEDLTDGPWRESADALGARLGLRRPSRLFVSARVGTPMAGGVWRPIIILPPGAPGWGAEQRDVVLAHEIAHLAGHDPLRHLAARLAVACYWFHPLAWMAAREAAVAREQACDEAVLALGTRPSNYARILLELAASPQPSAAGAGALPMVDRSNMETRIMAILNDQVRPATGGWRLVPAIALALLTLGIAAAQPAVRAAAVTTAEAPAGAAGVDTASLTPPVVPIAAERPPVRGSAAVQPAPVQIEAGRDSACWADGSNRTSFRGYSSTRNLGGRTIVSEQIGSRNFDRVIQKDFGDTRLCMLAEAAGDWTPTERPSRWIGRAPRVILEAQRRGVVQRLEVAGQRTAWQVGGVERAFDAAAQQWRDRMLAVLDTTWQISTLRGEVSSLAGEISSIRGHESSLRGEISSLHGEVSSMRGRQSSIRGEESTLRGRISSIRGQVSSLRGAISSEQGSISSLYAGGYPAAQVSKHEKEIARLEQEIKNFGADAKIADVERQIRALDADGKVDAIEKEIRAFDLDGKVAAIERQIAALDVDGKVAAIERQITALDSDLRVRQLENRRDEELKRLEAALAAIR